MPERSADRSRKSGILQLSPLWERLSSVNSAILVQNIPALLLIRYCALRSTAEISWESIRFVCFPIEPKEGIGSPGLMRRESSTGLFHEREMLYKSFDASCETP